MFEIDAPGNISLLNFINVLIRKRFSIISYEFFLCINKSTSRINIRAWRKRLIPQVLNIVSSIIGQFYQVIYNSKVKLNNPS